MSRSAKRLRKYVRETVSVDVRAWWGGIITLPLRKRLRLGWMLVTKQRGGAA